MMNLEKEELSVKRRVKSARGKGVIKMGKVCYLGSSR